MTTNTNNNRKGPSSSRSNPTQRPIANTQKTQKPLNTNNNANKKPTSNTSNRASSSSPSNRASSSSPSNRASSSRPSNRTSSSRPSNRTSSSNPSNRASSSSPSNRTSASNSPINRASNGSAAGNTPASKPRKKRRKKHRKLKIVLKSIFLLLVLAIIVVGIFVGKYVLDIISKAPKIDPTNVLGTLAQNSVIYDQNGEIIEQIMDATENREVVPLVKMPKHLRDAFIAIEDKRFEDHFGIDVKRILGAVFSNFKSGDLKGQGASTITQQLVKNLYLSNLKSLERKIMEAYLAIQMDRTLTKDEILENYLNTIGLGGNINGVQAAAYAYFSKDVSDLTIAESALLAAAPKGPAFSPYKRYSLDSLSNIPKEDILGYIYVGSIQYACVYNQIAIDRQHQVLYDMLDQGKINQKEYDEAMKVDMRLAIKPGIKKIEGITSNNFNDYVKEQVITDLMYENDLSYEEAEQYLFKGGLSIYSTMDVKMQRSIETLYENFGEIFLGGPAPESKPLAQDWSGFRWIDGKAYGTLDSVANILNDSGNVLYFKHDNILNENDQLYLSPEEYTIDEQGNLIISTNKLVLSQNYIDIVDCYTIDDKNQLVVHNIGGLNIGSNYEILENEQGHKEIKILSSYLKENPEFYTLNSENLLTINNLFYKYDEYGIIQPQSAAVVMDYRTGQVKAIIGGRDITGDKTFNRAVHAARQPGSSIKPVGVYIAALDHGYSAASVVDDVPLYNNNQRWPKNWYESFWSYPFYYKGLVTIRYAIHQSLNTVPVKIYNDLGADTIIKYFDKLGLVNLKHPGEDTFVTREENAVVNDINPSAIALGGLSNGFSPLKMTAAYGAIANDGTYVEPICYTKVVSRDGTVILDNTPKTTVAVVPDVAFILKDILRSGVTDATGLAGAAAIKGIDIDMAAKTGTTQDNGDFWCIGFSPYYVSGVWVGNDNPTVKLSETSTATARLLGALMTEIHQGYEPAKFPANENVAKVEVCKCSGLLPNEHCSNDPRGSQVISEYFIKGSEPVDTCETHILAKVCPDTLKLMNKYCPTTPVMEKVFITRPEPYDPFKYPFNKSNDYEELYSAIKLYRQISTDIQNGMSSKEILEMYPGLVTLKITTPDKKTTDDSNIVISDDDENDYVDTVDSPSDVANEMIEIETVQGFTLDQLQYRVVYVEDYDYQIPIDICTMHNHTFKDPNKSDKDDNDNEGNDNNNDDGDIIDLDPPSGSTNPVEPGPDPDPTEPGPDPAEPGPDPAEPGSDPTEPGSDPTEPGPDPAEPGPDPDPTEP